LTYAFSRLKSLGKVIGVEMVDEISSQFTVPFPQGQLGAPGGPQTLVCVNDLCSVTWPSPVVVENGELQFLITGATSNPNLNRAVPNVYKMNAGFNNGFSFTTTGVGTQTFTATTDPGLVFEMFATSQTGFGPTGNDYIHNDAIAKIMSFINAVPGGPPNETWPSAADAPGVNFAAWDAPGASSYSDMYFTYLNCTGTSGGLPLCLPSDAQRAFDFAWKFKSPYIQKGKPLLMETGDYGLSYNIVASPLAVTSFDGNTIVFSAPHGMATPTIGLARFSLTGNSNTVLNGNYYAYAAPSSTSLQVYAASPTGPMSAGGTITFADGQGLNLAVFPTQGRIEPNQFQMSGGPYCLHISNFNTFATVTLSPNAPYNGKWFVLPASFNGLDANGCAWNIKMRSLSTTTPGTGGTAGLIVDNYYHAGVSTLTQNWTSPDISAANIMYAAEKGAAGVRGYMFGGDANKNQALSNCFANCATHIDPNPLFNGPLAQATWQGVSNAFNLIDEIEPWLLQSQLPSPNYGSTMVTAARTSSYGTLLLMTEFANSPQVVTVDLSAYNPSGGMGTMYTMNGEELNHQSISGTSAQVTFAPAETVAFTFPAGS
jgi:hypothetical protein